MKLAYTFIYRGSEIETKYLSENEGPSHCTYLEEKHRLQKGSVMYISHPNN